MGLRQFANSISRILSNRHINRGRGIAKHIQWQGRKVLNLFPFEQTLSNSRIIASHRECGVSALIHSQGLYDYNNMKLMHELLSKGGTFIDIRANIGSYSLIASECPSAQIHAFEPHPGTFELLKRNIELNRRNNVALHNVALGSSEKKVLLTDRVGSSINHIVSDGSQATDTLAVPCHRMDTLCQRLKISPQIVKLDVEGFEYDVLQGFGAFISSIQVLMIEMNGLSDKRSHGHEEIHSLLLSDGLTGPWQCDFDRRQLLPLTSMNTEDSLYVSSVFREEAQKCGFTFLRSA